MVSDAESAPDRPRAAGECEVARCERVSHRHYHHHHRRSRRRALFQFDLAPRGHTSARGKTGDRTREGQWVKVLQGKCEMKTPQAPSRSPKIGRRANGVKMGGGRALESEIQRIPSRHERSKPLVRGRGKPARLTAGPLSAQHKWNGVVGEASCEDG